MFVCVALAARAAYLRFGGPDPAREVQIRSEPAVIDADGDAECERFRAKLIDRARAIAESQQRVGPDEVSRSAMLSGCRAA